MAVADAKKAESRANYTKATTPATTYKTPKGTEAKINSSDKQVSSVRDSLTQQKWTDRSVRQTTIYNQYSGSSYPPMMFGDPYHAMFSYWLLNQSMNTMAMFMLCHQSTMDDARVRDLYARNANLEREVANLRARGVQPDPAYTPPGIDPDLMYNDNYIDAVYNPHPKEVEEYEYDNGPTWGSFWHAVWVFIKWVFYIALFMAVVAVIMKGVCYLLFQARY